MITKKIIAVQDAISTSTLHQELGNGDARQCVHNNQTKPSCTQTTNQSKSGVKSTQQNNLSFVHSPTLTKPSSVQSSNQTKPNCVHSPIQTQPLSVQSPNQTNPLGVHSPNQTKPLGVHSPNQTNPLGVQTNDKTKSSCVNPTNQAQPHSVPTQTQTKPTPTSQTTQTKPNIPQTITQCKKPGPLLAHFIEETCIYDDSEHTRLLETTATPVITEGRDKHSAKNGVVITSDLELLKREDRNINATPSKHRIVINLDDKNKFTDEITV